MPAFGVYPIADARPVGEVSSTYEGRHITVLASACKHAGGLVTKNLPVVIGERIVGIAFNTEVAGTDLITVDTEGIWIVDVWGRDDAGNIAVAGGDSLFIDITDGSCIVSKIRNVALNIPFGYALGIITTPGNTERIAVKVHHDPTVDSQRIQYNTVVSGAYGKQSVGILAAGNSQGVAHYFSSQVAGQQDGLIYGVGSWIDLGADFIGTSSPLTPVDTGVYNAPGSDISLSRIIFAGQHMAILDAVPGQMYAWRLNVAAAAGPITALIQAGNIQSVGYIAAITETADPIGYIPLAFIAGIAAAQPCYVRVYTGTA